MHLCVVAVHLPWPAVRVSFSDQKADGEAVANGKLAAVEESGKKERSVLQAKLTRLAIQIGYAGLSGHSSPPNTHS